MSDIKSWPLRWYRYTLPNGRDVYLTNRPDSCNPESVDDFIRSKDPGIRFMFTDDYVNPPADGPTWHWFPWVPSKNPALENIYAFLTLMARYEGTAPLSKPVWLHCDSSTMRAPTHFGLFLYAFYRDSIDLIKNSLVVHEGSYEHVSDVQEYAETEFRLQPESKILVDHFANGDFVKAYDFYMGRK